MKKIRNGILMGAVLLIAIIFTAACAKKVDSIEEKTNKTEENTYDYKVLINKYVKLPDDWESKVELVTAKDVHGDDIKVEKKALEAYYKLEKDLENDGIDIELDSVYRSVQDQQDLIDEWTADPTKGPDYVKKFVGVPGYSEHHTGLAIDICLVKDGKIIDDNDEMIAEKEIFAKIHSKLADYGFILRYPEGKEESSGYTYEPWHFRYIDDVDMAFVIMNENMTYEEYLENYDDIKSLDAAAKLKIVETLQDYFKDVYDNKISDAKFNIKKIYTDGEDINVKLSDKDIAFEVEYQVYPSDDVDYNELMIPNGEYDSQSGWVKNISRVGILKYNSKDNTYSIENFGTGW